MNSGETLSKKLPKSPLMLVAIVLGVMLDLLILAWIAMAIFPVEAEPTKTVSAPGMNAPAPSTRLNWLGMDLLPLNPTLCREFFLPADLRGLLVINEGPITELKSGDVITGINNQAISRAADLSEFTRGAGYDGYLLDIYSRGKRGFLSVPGDFAYGPAQGPQAGRWTMGTPVYPHLVPYGPLINSTGK
ncbi:MAG: hypothetical protein HQL31_07875 [Planctomycetes bacterium]|nr:hypothetical protein [Planctomycetota bacterium]